MATKSTISKKILIVIAALVVIGGAWVGFDIHKRNTAPTGIAAVQQKVIAYDGVEGKTAYDLLKEKYQVQADTSSFGVMVKSINGLASTDKEFWLYSVNGKQPDVAADKYVTKASDKIEWDYKGM